MKKNYGGQRDNAGRKPSDPILGARIKTAITMRPDHFGALAGKNRSAYIDAGLDVVQYAIGHSPAEDACLVAYYAISNAIQRLERIRDYNPTTGEQDSDFHWSDADAALHTDLCRYWEEIRRQPAVKKLDNETGI